MKLSMRSRYGFRAILEIAAEKEKKPVQIKVIAKRQDISIKYLEQIVGCLKTAQIVRSLRGPRGGYLLTRPASEIKLSEVFLALEGAPISIDCLQHPEYCSRCKDCLTRVLWMEMHDAILGVLEPKTLQEMIDRLGENGDKAGYQI
jgi:Rrf2 family cysteine metabolism transcriptional repressor